MLTQLLLMNVRIVHVAGYLAHIIDEGDDNGSYKILLWGFSKINGAMHVGTPGTMDIYFCFQFRSHTLHLCVKPDIKTGINILTSQSTFMSWMARPIALYAV